MRGRYRWLSKIRKTKRLLWNEFYGIVELPLEDLVAQREIEMQL